MDMVKPSRNKKARNFFVAAPKMVSCLRVAAEKKNTIFGAAKTIFGPSYSVTALAMTT